MDYVRYIDSPKVDDRIGFMIETYDDKGVLKNPYLINKVTIYRLEHHVSKNELSLETKKFNPELLKAHDQLQEEIRQNPTTDNVERLKNLLTQLDKTADVRKINYANARIVMQTISPLWTYDLKKTHVANIRDNIGIIQGKFLFLWTAKGMREGTYFIQWEWKNAIDGAIHTTEKVFTLYPAEEKIHSVYRHFAPREKYNFLLEKYVPKMYRVQTTPNDRTPEVVRKFNKVVGQMFLELDDLAVGLVDLLDPMFTPEGFLPAIANFFNLELKTTSVTAWRNQIKNAVPLYKKKGTAEGLKQALDKANVKLIKITNLWQVISPYTWVEGFVTEKDIWTNNEVLGHLTKKPLKDAKIEVYLKSSETKEYFSLPENVVYFQETLVPEPKIAVVWNGGAHQPPIELFAGDVVKIRYSYNKMPTDAGSIEGYIEDLPLADQRDETKVRYPIKNWNVKLIEEDDPLFDLVIPERHSFYTPVTYGKTRTTFLYSEKAFNMDTYNGSLYNSNNPCDMDKDFLDPCSGGQSSKFNVHLEFEHVDDEKIMEAKDIITDYSPFHAVLHNMKISSRITDFVLPPAEKITGEVKTKPVGDKVAVNEAIYCQITYKDGTVKKGRVV